MLSVKKDFLNNVCFIVFLIIGLYIGFSDNHSVIPASAAYCNNKIIILDAGHGYPDGGAVGISGSLEKDINLQITKKVGEYFTKCGAKVVYTRIDDNAVSSDLSKKISEIKKEDMKNRLWIRDNSEADLFISIHMNKFSDSKYHGAQVFYDGNFQESKSLASYICSSLKKYADKENKREIKDSNNSLYLLKNSTIPAVLVECGFLSNYSEEKALLTDSYQEKIAFSIFSGTVEFLSANKN